MPGRPSIVGGNRGIIGNAPGIKFINDIGGGFSWQSYWTQLTPMPLSAYGTSETNILLSVTDVFGGKARITWYAGSDGLTFTKLTTTGAGVVSYNYTVTAGTFKYFRCRAEQGSNYSQWSNIVGTASWCADYTTLYNSISGAKPSIKIADAQNYFIWYQQGNNADARDTWAKYSCILPYCGGMPSSEDALRWWNAPATRSATLSAHAPEYTIGKGFAGDIANTAYIDTTWNPVADGGTKYTQNDCAFGVYHSNIRSDNNNWQSGVYNSSNNSYIAISPSFNGLLFALNSDFATAYLTAGGTNNILIATRTDGTNFYAYADKTALGAKAKASAALVNLTVTNLVRRNGAATYFAYSNDTIGMWFASASFDQTDVNILVDAFSRLMGAVTTEAIAPSSSKMIIPVDTYVAGNDEVVHIAVKNTGEAWNGYKYWMATTPYPGSDSAYENPSIYCSNDGITWVTPIGLTNPVVPAPIPPYNADPFLFFENNKLYLGWITTEVPLSIYLIESSDGVNWSAKTPIATKNDGFGDTYVSIPSIVKVGGYYYLYYASNFSGVTQVISRRRSTNIYGPYTNKENITFAAPDGLEYNHFGVNYLFGKYYITAFVCADTAHTQDANSVSIYLGVSADGVTFTRSTNPIVGNSKSWEGRLYMSVIEYIENKWSLYYNYKGATWGLIKADLYNFLQ